MLQAQNLTDNNANERTPVHRLTYATSREPYNNSTLMLANLTAYPQACSSLFSSFFCYKKNVSLFKVFT